MTMTERPLPRILVYEFISAAGAGVQLSTGASTGGHGAPPDDGAGDAGEPLLLQGIAMRDAIAADLLAAGRYQVCVADSAAAPFPLPATAASPEGRDTAHERFVRHGAACPPRGSDAARAPSARSAAPGCATLRAMPDETPAAFLARVSPGFDRVWVVAPETDGILAGLCCAVGPARWAGCDAGAIALCGSKTATRMRLAAHGIAVPDGWQPGEARPHPDGAWIVKPDDGAGTQDTRRHAGFDAARAAFTAHAAGGRPFALERWVDGEPLSLSLLCGSRGAELLCINRQRIRLGADGKLGYHGVDVGIEAPGGARGRVLGELAHAVHAAVPGLAGFVGIDLVWTSGGQPVVIEINPRPTCAYVGLSARIGRNLAAGILASDTRSAAAAQPSGGNAAGAFPCPDGWTSR